MRLLQNRSGVSLFGVPASTAKNIGGVVATGNVATITPSGTDVFTDFDLAATAALSSNSVGWTLSTALTGELTYQGATPFSGVFICSVTAIKVSGGGTLTFRALRNGSILADDVLSRAQANASGREISLILPLTMTTGDTLRLQFSSSLVGDIVIENLSAQAV